VSRSCRPWSGMPALGRPTDRPTYGTSHADLEFAGHIGDRGLSEAGYNQSPVTGPGFHAGSRSSLFLDVVSGLAITVALTQPDADLPEGPT
jgi:hypothetical protein